MSYSHLVNRAKKLRQDTFTAFVEHGEAHLGRSFSMIEILIALFEEIMVNEDKFILSKAHASFPLCLVLKEKGLNPRMSTHLEIDPDNGIYCTTGSLGHGLPIATGMALARSIKRQKGNIYVMMSDGECQEGTTWESLLIGAKHQLHNMTVIIDYNKITAKFNVNLPHPRMHKRAFVLIPLFEIEKRWKHPLTGQDIKDLIFSLPNKDISSIKQI